MRILILRISALGDAIHTLPAINLIKEHLPSCTIDWLVQEKIMGIVSRVPGINAIFKLDNNYLSPRFWKKTFRVLAKLRQNNYDLIIDFQGLYKTSFIIAALDHSSIGFGYKAAREHGSALVHSYNVSPLKSLAIIEKNLTLARAAITYLSGKSILHSYAYAKKIAPLTPMASSSAEKNINEWLMQNTGRKRLIITAPNTTWESKHWPLERWEELFSKLRPQKNHCFILVGKNFGAQGKHLASIISSQNLPILIAPAWNIDEIFAIMPHTDLIIAPDTGLLHIADCFGVATIGLYGPTKVTKHGPKITQKNQQLCLQANCPHHYQKTHSNILKYSATQDCMYKISADAVLERMVEIIQQSSIREGRYEEVRNEKVINPTAHFQ